MFISSLCYKAISLTLIARCRDEHPTDIQAAVPANAPPSQPRAMDNGWSAAPLTGANNTGIGNRRGRRVSFVEPSNNVPHQPYGFQPGQPSPAFNNGAAQNDQRNRRNGRGRGVQRGNGTSEDDLQRRIAAYQVDVPMADSYHSGYSGAPSPDRVHDEVHVRDVEMEDVIMEDAPTVQPFQTPHYGTPSDIDSIRFDGNEAWPNRRAFLRDMRRRLGNRFLSQDEAALLQNRASEARSARDQASGSSSQPTAGATTGAVVPAATSSTPASTSAGALSEFLAMGGAIGQQLAQSVAGQGASMTTSLQLPHGVHPNDRDGDTMMQDNSRDAGATSALHTIFGVQYNFNGNDNSEKIIATVQKIVTAHSEATAAANRQNNTIIREIVAGHRELIAANARASRRPYNPFLVESDAGDGDQDDENEDEADGVQENEGSKDDDDEGEGSSTDPTTSSPTENATVDEDAD